MDEKRPTLTDEQLLEAVHDWVVKLCNTGGRAWTLRVPVDHDRDPDILISELCRRFKEKAKLRALDEQQFAKLKASFDKVVRQRDEYRREAEAAKNALRQRIAESFTEWTVSTERTIERLMERYLKIQARQAGEGESLAQVASDVTCPQCGNPSVKYPSGDSEYCEDCGWPDEDFGEGGV